MKQMILVLMMSLSAFALGAQGKDQNREFPGPFPGEPREILVVEGTLTEGEYGQWEVQQGEIHFLLPPFMIQEEAQAYLGRSLELEGIAGPVLFTKGEESYQVFRPLKVLVDGEELELDLPGLCRRGWAGGRPGQRGGDRRVGPCHGGFRQDYPCLEDEEGQYPDSSRRGNRE